MRSHSPIRYCPRLYPSCEPATEQKAMTWDDRDHMRVMASISIQWAVMPMKDSLVWLTDQRSVVIDARPVVGSLFSSILYVLTDIYATHTNCFLQLIDKFDELILYIRCNGVGCGNISLNRVWVHGHEAILKRGFVRNSKALESQYQLSLCTMQLHSPGYHKQQTWQRLSALHPSRIPSPLLSEMHLPASAMYPSWLASSPAPAVSHDDSWVSLSLHTFPCIHQSGCGYVADTKSYRQHEMLIVSLSLPQIPHCPSKMVR